VPGILSKPLLSVSQAMFPYCSAHGGVEAREPWQRIAISRGTAKRFAKSQTLIKNGAIYCEQPAHSGRSARLPSYRRSGGGTHPEESEKSLLGGPRNRA
jgi:hypothetical protein